jgi:outer membrane protein TolC
MRALLLASSLLLPVQALAQDWSRDRFVNSITQVDAIDARFRAQIREEISRLHRRSGEAAEPTQRERQAVSAFRPWWMQRVTQPLEPANRTLPMTLAFMFDSALVNSQQMRVFGDLPAIRETTAREVAGRYVPRAYTEGRYSDVNDPTQSLAITGGATRLLQRERSIEFGVRQRLPTGGDVAIGQRFSTLSTNSNFFNPSNQSLSRSFITIVQPVLREGGVAYTRSLHEVARIDGRGALSEFRRQFEGHLTEISRAYWTLWLARAQFLQRQRLVEQTRPLVGQMQGRTGLDADAGTAARARAALTVREADLVRARSAVRNAEARLRGLVNDPRFEVERIGEFLPLDRPVTDYAPQTLEGMIANAVAFRPEVEQVFLNHRAAVLREGQAQIESLPRFDVILEANIGGRAIGTDLGGAWQDGRRAADRPGGVAGFRVEVPLATDDARARLDRRRLETRQIESQGRATVATIITEVEVTLNEYRVAYRELAARIVAMSAAETDVRSQAARFTGGATGGADALDRLLLAQDRLAAAEEAVAQAQATFTVAFTQLARVSGTFTASERLDVQRIDDANRGPLYVVRRGPNDAPRPGGGSVQPISNTTPAPRPAAPNR